MSEIVRTQVELPREVLEALRERSEARGLTLAQQILEVLKAYLGNQDDPVLRADDPVFRIAGTLDSGIGDLSIHHDRYLYDKDWQKQPQGGTAE